MYRSGLVFAVFFLSAIFLTRRSIDFPVFHFLMTPFWIFPLMDWWVRKSKFFFFSGLVVFLIWQVYFGFHAGFSQLPILWLLCAGMAGALIGVKKLFDYQTLHRAVQVQEKKKELEATQKKYDSRQQSLDHLERQVASLLNLFEIARELSEAADFSSLADNLSKSLANELAFSQVALWVPIRAADASGRMFRVYEIRAGSVDSREVLGGPGAELLGKLESQRQMVRDQDNWYFPAFDQNQLYAIFAVHGADEKDLAKIEVLSSFLALLVKKISLYETIRELSIVDDLTQVFVRRHFMERLKEEVKRSQRFKTPLSLLMLDIDHFKRYNDDFGHLVGDATLKKVAEILKLSVRRVDLVGRYGGEEFIVVMPETRQKDALEVAERIRSSVARHTFKLYHVETKVTVSQGIATYEPQGTVGTDVLDPAPVMDKLIQAADKCLYQAKEDGRNRVMIFKEQV